jgi:multiple sugar transport system substrate-binding protein
MGITTNANTEAAQQFLKFWFNEGYLDWLAVAAEGKFPMRRGTADEPTKFVEGWKQLQTGVDRKAALSEFYSDETINTLIEGAGSFNRWGFPQAQGPLVSAVYEALIVPRLLNDVIGGNLTPEEAAADMQTQVEELKANLK